MLLYSAFHLDTVVTELSTYFSLPFPSVYPVWKNYCREHLSLKIKGRRQILYLLDLPNPSSYLPFPLTREKPKDRWTALTILLPSLAGKQRKKNTDVAHDGSCTAFYCKSC
jgi:hypothetical protein